MASELSQFIEKELESQDVHEDEQKRLLDDLRSKPSPVVPLPWWKRGYFKKVLLAVAVIAVIALAVVGAGVTARNRGLTWNDIVKSQDGGVVEEDVQGAKAPPPPKKVMPPLEPKGDLEADSKTVEAVEEEQTEDEDDVEDYVDSENEKFDEEAKEAADYEKMIEKIEEEKDGEEESPKKQKDSKGKETAAKDTAKKGNAGKGAAKVAPVEESPHAEDALEADYAPDYDDYGEESVMPDTE